MGLLRLFDMVRGDEVKDQWLEKNVDLSRLTERIRPFFNEKEFKVTVEETQEGYVIQAKNRIPNLKLEVNVEILGEPNDFTVEFSTGSKGGHFSPLMIVGYLTAMFGGGYLISKEAEKREALDMLEKDFWSHTQMQVADLAGSTISVKSKSKTSSRAKKKETRLGS
jgi:hypothetical protein